MNAIRPGGVDTALKQAVQAMMQESGYFPDEFPNMRIGRFADGELFLMADIIEADRVKDRQEYTIKH